MPVSLSEKSELIERLNELLKKQSLFQQEINELQLQITQLKTGEEKTKSTPVENKVIGKATKPEPKLQKTTKVIRKPEPIKSSHLQNEPLTLEDLWKKTGIGSEMEQFIGTNLINKIGMIVVIIGVGIGAKYAIDNDLISPAMRIVLGYLVGGILSFFAIRLKKNYFNFSAVLFSGAMAIHFFISYAAYTYYGLYPHTLTFILMVLFTVLTVGLALYYNRQIIAHFGLAGAYITPFLLADPDSSILVLFIYMVIINSGILFLSTKKQWKPLNYVAYVATWVIFMSWFSSDKNQDQLGISLTFATLFFAIFYLVFLSYKLVLKEKLKVDDIVFLLLNSAAYYLIGFIALEGMSIETDFTRFQGLFTLINVIIHSITAFFIFKSDKENKKLFYWTIGIVVAFATIAFGIQFNKYLASVLWSLELVILFWLGRSKKIPLFDYLSFALICVLLISVGTVWFEVSYNFQTDVIRKIYKPILRWGFLVSLTAITAFSFIFYFNRKFPFEKENYKNWLELFNIFFSAFFLIVLYFTFYTEIDLYWNNVQVFTSYELNADGYWQKAYEQLNQDIFVFSDIWLVIYSILFLSILAFANYRWIKNSILNGFIFVMGAILIVIFLLGTENSLNFLRRSYLNPNPSGNYDVSVFHLLIRYLAYLFFALHFYSIYKFTLNSFTNKNLRKAFEITLSISIIWICSSELINWLSLSGSTEIYKHSLSILWGTLSFILIGYGIWKKKKHLRVTSIILFGGTILKLFFYDLTHLETIPKTIVFISIGGLLLVVSFMYNKYRSLIFGND